MLAGGGALWRKAVGLGAVPPRLGGGSCEREGCRNRAPHRLIGTSGATAKLVGPAYSTYRVGLFNGWNNQAA